MKRSDFPLSRLLLERRVMGHIEWKPIEDITCNYSSYLKLWILVIRRIMIKPDKRLYDWTRSCPLMYVWQFVTLHWYLTLCIIVLQVDFQHMRQLKPHRRAIRRTFQPGVWLQYKTSLHQTHLHAKINRVQVRCLPFMANIHV